MSDSTTSKKVKLYVSEGGHILLSDLEPLLGPKILDVMYYKVGKMNESGEVSLEFYDKDGNLIKVEQ